MKRVFAAAALFTTLSVHAITGVSVGHHTWADDGFPSIGPGEQVKVFVCEEKGGSGRSAMVCAVEKCVTSYGIKFDKNTPVRKLPDGTSLVAERCTADGWSERKGYSLIVVGPPGDNHNIFVKSIGARSREDAVRSIRSGGFPFERGTIVLDKYDPYGIEQPKNSP